MDAQIKYRTVPYTRGTGLEMGRQGEEKGFAHWIGISPREVRLFAPQRFDFVVVRAYEDQGQLSAAWECLKPGGHMVYALAPDALPAKWPRGGWQVMESRDLGAHHLLVLQKRCDRKQMPMAAPANRRACVVRYGGFGDMIQASSVLPHLKEQGFEVTVMTHPRGQQVMAADPHVDRWWLQDQDQVPNAELPEYWQTVSTDFTRWINLSETVEASCLAIPARAQFLWPEAARRRVCNVNYQELTHLVADVPMDFRPRFYPTEEERRRIRKWRKTIPGRLIIWTAAGSSVHKYWPYQDNLFARILLGLPDAHILVAGDFACKIWEQGWEKEPRIIKTAGEWPIRDVLTAVEAADLVMGPETGVLNAASHLPVKKIVLLSHSSHENLSKHWINCTTLVPDPVRCPCHPCHRLHYGWDHCTIDTDTDAALCAASISLEAAWAAVQRAME